MKMARLYINWCYQTNILFGCAQTKKSEQGKTPDILSPISWAVHYSYDETLDLS